jgi:hypothetical protein
MKHLFPVLLVGLALPAGSAGIGTVPPDPDKLLLLDRRVIDSVEQARLVPGKVVKEARNPLFQADKPWENSLNNLYPNLLWDEEEGLFKLWYKCVLADKEVIAMMDGPSTVHDVGWYLLYATSRDGLTWDKPTLGLFAHGGDRDTNIVARDVPNVGVFKDPRDPDPARRYKMVYDIGLGQLRTRFSADGIHWGEPVAVTGFTPQHGDTHNNAFWDPRIRRYVWFTKLYIGERTVARLESEDFSHWRDTGMVLRSTVEEGRVSQTYCLPVFPYANVYLGYVMMYNVGKGRTVDCELAWSHDGVRWQRVAPGVPFLPRGAPGTYDSQCIYAQAGPATAQDGQLLIYYGGSDFPHQGWKRHCLLSLARLRVDGFAGYEPADPGRPAVLTTAPVILAARTLTLSADAAGGRVDVEVLDVGNRVLAKAAAVTGDVTDHPLAVDLQPLLGRTVRLRFTLARARLYAFGGAKLADLALPASPLPPLARVPARAAPLRITFDPDAAGWRGGDRLEHRREGGVRGGFVSVAREKGLPPFLTFAADAKPAPLAGDWSELLGGDEAIVTWQTRTSQAGSFNLEIFAQETQWSRRVAAAPGPGWQTHTVTLRYDWTDAQAEAAGWTRSRTAFSWRDTIRHVGRIAVGFLPDQEAGHSAFDLDEIDLRGK